MLLYIGIGIFVAPLHRLLAIWLDFTVRNLQGTLDIPVSQMLDQVKLVIVSTSIDSFLTYWVIIGVFLGIDYYNGYREKQVNNAKLEAELSKSQLNNLKAQLHPHFLFNSIQAISTLMHRDIELADNALTRLSFLLRKSFENINTQKISLKEEMEFLNHYIQLQKLRFQEKVDISINVQEETLDYLVPTLILQPLVENAFKHGIEASRKNGTISIYTEIEKNSIILKICNSVNNTNNQPQNGNGVGLNNTRERLEHLYGENSFLEIESSKKGEFKISIKIPAEKTTFFE